MANQSPVSLADALRYWLKLGCISFGGPAGQIAIQHKELVEKRRWISEERFLHALNYCMLLPGPEAQQLATYIGWLMHGVKGGIIAGALFVLPSLLILIALSWLYVTFGQTPIISGLLYGIKPTVTAIVAFAAWRIGSRVLKNGFLWALAILAFTAIFFFRIPFPWIILGAALIGFIAGKLRPDWCRKYRHAKSLESFGPAVLDDLTPLPDHARFSPRRIALIAVIGLALWAGALALLGGWMTYAVHCEMGWFFTQAALLTFGGAYAVLPYVYQGAVEQHQWLSAHAMIDGLALGETTPGPLIMIVAFVGYWWRRQRNFWCRQRLCRRRGGCVRCDVFYFFAVVFIHISGRAAGRSHTQQSQIHGAAERHHGSSRRRHRQSRTFFCVACFVAKCN